MDSTDKLDKINAEITALQLNIGPYIKKNLILKSINGKIEDLNKLRKERKK